ncbi:heme NO-binding domain-containing protein, partial [Frigidibacter sp. MR17.24]|uniref:heme NO-binding domain-containing protein n=1 Tax=Frigidibacter sp. MR17.24 TaxID=3127345 RepID=UPI003012A0FC
MHGLVNRSLQCFLRDAYPPRVWHDIAGDLAIGPDGFEAMLDYPEAATHRFLSRAARRLGKPEATLLEDLGAYLVGRESLRRLLRFGGGTYPDFLLSLEDLPDRAAIALPELRLPPIAVAALEGGHYRLAITEAAAPRPGGGPAPPH